MVGQHMKNIISRMVVIVFLVVPAASALARQPDEESMYSKATALGGTGKCAEALPLYEKALALADDDGDRDSSQLAHIVVGMGKCYARTGRFQEFNTLYE